ncbi:MAG: hypothetical protein CFE48_06915 [Pseudomonas sp. PGPPP2]|nr:MAG: hypothetical protein CFE48_06915 [Pseudomonas sp. PGPPP2]
MELHEHLFPKCYLPSLSPMVESKRSAPARKAKGVRMEALRAKTPLAAWFTTADRQGTPKKLLAPQGFLGFALAVASATNGSSGQKCFGYLPLRSFLTSA